MKPQAVCPWAWPQAQEVQAGPLPSVLEEEEPSWGQEEEQEEQEEQEEPLHLVPGEEEEQLPSVREGGEEEQQLSVPAAAEPRWAQEEQAPWA